MSKLFTVILTKEIRIRNKKVRCIKLKNTFLLNLNTFFRSKKKWKILILKYLFLHTKCGIREFNNVLLIDFILRDERLFCMSIINFFRPLALYICNTIAAVVLQTTHHVGWFAIPWWQL